MHKQRYYPITLLVAILVAASSILFLDYRLYAQPEALSCPRQQTVVLSGSNAPPLQGLIVLFAGQVVGGGFSDPAGNWRIPLRVNEPPGIYPVEVRLRSNQQLLASMLCYVDVPLPATATSLPTATPLPTATAIARPTTALPAIPDGYGIRAITNQANCYTNHAVDRHTDGDWSGKWHANSNCHSFAEDTNSHIGEDSDNNHHPRTGRSGSHD